MPFADRKDAPLFKLEKVEVEQRVFQHSTEQILEDLGEVDPNLKDQFDATEALTQQLREIAAQAPDFDYEDYLHMMRANLKGLIKARKNDNTLIAAKIPHWDKRGKDMQREALKRLHERKQAAAEAAARAIDEEVAAANGMVLPPSE